MLATTIPALSEDCQKGLRGDAGRARWTRSLCYVAVELRSRSEALLVVLSGVRW